MDAYLEEELYDLFTFCIKEPQSPEVSAKKKRALENRIKEEIGSDAKPYRAWWNGVAPDWNY